MTTFLRLTSIIFCLIVNCLCYSQENLTSEEALKKYKEITEVMEASFPEDEYLTYRRESFSEQQLHNYLIQHYKRLDLLPLIKEHYVFKMNSYMHAGNWFKKTGFPRESIKWYNVFFKYYNKYHSKLSVEEINEFITMVPYSYSMQAQNYIGIGELDNAATVHKINIKFIEDKNVVSYPSALNNYGLYFYWNKKDLDSALIYFNKAYKITLEKFPNHSLLGSIRDNIADIYTAKNQHEKALSLYKTNFDYYSSFKIKKTKQNNQSDKISRLISAATQQIESQLKLKQSLEAIQTLKRLQKMLLDPYYNDITPSSRLKILKVQEILYHTQTNYEKAYDIALKRDELKDSLNFISKIADKKWREQLNTISLNRTTQDFNIDKIQKENKIKRQRLELWIISILALSIIGILTGYYFRRRGLIIIARNKLLIAEQSLKLTDLENMQLQNEIESKKRDLSDFAISLTQNQEWAKELADKIENIKTINAKEQKALIEDLELEIQNKITVDGDTQEFYERLDKLSDSFYRKLEKKFNKLSKNEIRLCSLIRLKMDSRSIASLQNITLASHNTSRYRLRKKLNLQEEMDLDSFIQNL